MFGPVRGNTSMAILSLLGAMTATAVGLQAYEKSQGRPMKVGIQFGGAVADGGVVPEKRGEGGAGGAGAR